MGDLYICTVCRKMRDAILERLRVQRSNSCVCCRNRNGLNTKYRTPYNESRANLNPIWPEIEEIPTGYKIVIYRTSSHGNFQYCVCVWKGVEEDSAYKRWYTLHYTNKRFNMQHQFSLVRLGLDLERSSKLSCILTVHMMWSILLASSWLKMKVTIIEEARSTSHFIRLLGVVRTHSEGLPAELK